MVQPVFLNKSSPNYGKDLSQENLRCVTAKFIINK